MNITETISRFIVESSFKDFPEEVIKIAKRSILDWISVALGGSKDPAASILMDHIKDIGGEEQATILGHGTKTNTLNAAFVNGSMSHILDFDDAHGDVRNHPSAPLLPSLISIAEHKGLSGYDLLTAYIIGYDVSTRIGLALGKEYYEKGWHGTSILGRFGSAAGTAKLLGLTPEQIKHALGLAATQAGGIRSSFGTMGKPFHAGKAAMDGMLSVMLAKRGFTGPDSILEGDAGFVNLLTSEYEPEYITKGLGDEYHIINNHFKIHAACLLSHPVIDALISIKEQHNPSTESIDRIELEVAPLCFSVTNRAKVSNSYEAKFSLQYCSVVALIKGLVGKQEISETLISDNHIKELMKKVEIRVNASMEESEADVLVSTRDGNRYSEHVSYPKGGPMHPVTFQDILEKFKGLNKEFLTEDNIEDIGATIKNIEKIPNISKLVDLCSFQFV